MHIGANRPQVAGLFHNDRLEPALEHVAGTPVPFVRPHREARIHIVHEPAQVPLRRAQHQMKMIVHQHVRVQYDLVALHHRAQQFQQVRPIFRGVENGAPVVPPCRHMVHRSRILQP